MLLAVLMLAACTSKPAAGKQDPAASEVSFTQEMETESHELLTLLDSLNCSCVVRNNGITTRYIQRGVRDLYELVSTRPEVLRGAHVADKIIGKGAAALLVLGKASRATTHTITTPALKMLREAGMEVRYGNEVPYVENWKKTGQCPLDARLQEVDSVHLCLPVIRQFIQDLDDGKVF